MLFFDINFLVLFLTPVAAIAYGLKVARLQRLAPWVAIAASLAFLGVFSFISVAVAILSLTVNYFAGKWLIRDKSRSVLSVIISLNVAVLLYFKYSVFLTDNIFGPNTTVAWRLALPLGISFYTFQQIAFLSDIYRGKTTEFTLRDYLLFKLYFPQLIAGPIVHFERVKRSYQRWPTFCARSIRYGLLLLAMGFIKKLIGDEFGSVANLWFDNQHNMSLYGAWVGALSFSLQIYFDFSGYSDMAVGLGRLFGVSLPFNFNSPYKARSLADFWRRWHITLSQWLRDYLYISLGGNRHGQARMFMALFVTMAIGGLWHGAAWTFIAWGVAHGLAQIVARLFPVKLPYWLARPLLLVFIVLTWVLFRSTSMAGALQHYEAMLDIWRLGFGVELWRVINLLIPFVPVPLDSPNVPQQFSELGWILAAGFICLTMPNSQQIALWAAARKVKAFLHLEIPLLVAIIVSISLAFNSPDNGNAFIYFEF